MFTLIVRGCRAAAHRGSVPATVLVVGPSGAGKTTFVDGAVGLLDPDSGPQLPTVGFYTRSRGQVTLWEIGGADDSKGYEWAEGMFSCAHVVLLVVDTEGKTTGYECAKDLLDWAYDHKAYGYTPIYILLNRCYDANCVNECLNKLGIVAGGKVFYYPTTAMVLIEYIRGMYEGDEAQLSAVIELIRSHEHKNKKAENSNYESIIDDNLTLNSEKNNINISSPLTVHQEVFSKIINIIISNLKHVREKYEGNINQQKKLRTKENSEYEKASRAFREQKIREFQERKNTINESIKKGGVTINLCTDNSSIYSHLSMSSSSSNSSSCSSPSSSHISMLNSVKDLNSSIIELPDDSPQSPLFEVFEYKNPDE